MSISSKLPLSTQLELDDPTSAPQESIFDTPAYKESSFKTSEVEESARNSLDFLAALALPTVFKYLFPPVFQAGLLGAPRDHYAPGRLKRCPIT